MTYYADGTPYAYGRRRVEIGTINVGWLSRDHPYAHSEQRPDESFLAAIAPR